MYIYFEYELSYNNSNSILGYAHESYNTLGAILSARQILKGQHTHPHFVY